MKGLEKLIGNLMEFGLEKALGLYYGSYRAYVFSNEDPLFINRVRLLIPFISNEIPYKHWAFQKDSFSGKDYGSQCLPLKGDMVWVEFENGNLERPIWLHGHSGKDEITDETLRNYKNYWFKTPGGHLVELDDNTNEIRFTHKAGLKYVCSDKGISLVRNDKKISLGALDTSAEPALLGETTAKLLKDIISMNNDLIKTMQTFGTTESGVAQGPLAPLNAGFLKLNLDLAAALINIEGLTNRVEGIKSENVTLD